MYALEERLRAIQSALKTHFFFCTYLGKQQRADPRGFTLDPIVIRDRRGWI